MNTEPIDLEFMGAREVTASFETAPSTSLESFVLRGLRERGLSARRAAGLSTHEHPGFKKPPVRAHAPNG